MSRLVKQRLRSRFPGRRSLLMALTLSVLPSAQKFGLERTSNVVVSVLVGGSVGAVRFAGRWNDERSRR